MKVYLIRHGQTVSNADGTIQAWSDSKLSEKGGSQARELAKVMSGRHFDRIIASDLYRAKQTLKIVFGDVDAEFDERLREIDNNCLAGKNKSEILSAFGEEFTHAWNFYDYGFFGGESVKHFKKRVLGFMRDLEKDEKSESVAIVTHSGTIHAFISNITGIVPNEMEPVISNCSVSVAEYTKNDGWKMLSINNKNEF